MFYREGGLNQFDKRCLNILERIKTSSQMQDKPNWRRIKVLKVISDFIVQISKMKLNGKLKATTKHLKICVYSVEGKIFNLFF